MATFERSDTAFDTAFDRAMEAGYIAPDGEVVCFHKDLIDTKAQVLALLASPNTDDYGEKKGPALQKGGLPVFWKVKVKNLEHRCAYGVDAEFFIDKEAWNHWTEEEKYAAVDEMLYSLEVQRDKDKCIRSDDIGHPILKIRKPDIVIETYKAMVERHRNASEGCKAIERIAGFHKQLLMDFATDAIDDVRDEEIGNAEEVARNTTVTVRPHAPTEDEDGEPAVRMMDRADAAERHKPARPKADLDDKARAKALATP